MLTMKAPIELKCNMSMISSQEVFYHKIMGNYGMISNGITKEELLHVVTTPPEVYLAEGGMTNLVSQTNVQNRQETKIEVLNNFLNRISVAEDVNLTYQDRVYVSSVLKQLGIKNIQEFMHQVFILKEEAQQTEELTSLYWNHLSELSQTVAEYHQQEQNRSRTEVTNRVQQEQYLHKEIMNRLQTGAIYQIVNNFNKSWWNLGQYVERQELMVAEQKRISNQVLLNQLKTVVRGEALPFVYRHENHYEEVELHENRISDEEINSHITSAVLLNLVDNLLLTRMERNFGGHQVWLRVEDALYQTAENTLIRFKNELSEYGIRQEKRENNQFYQNVSYRQEIQAVEKLLETVWEEQEQWEAPKVGIQPKEDQVLPEPADLHYADWTQEREEVQEQESAEGKKERKTPVPPSVFMEKVEKMLEEAEAGKRESRGQGLSEQEAVQFLHVNLEESASEELPEERGAAWEVSAEGKNIPENRENVPESGREKASSEEREFFLRESESRESFREEKSRLERQVEQYLKISDSRMPEVQTVPDRVEIVNHLQELREPGNGEEGGSEPEYRAERVNTITENWLEHQGKNAEEASAIPAKDERKTQELSIEYVDNRNQFVTEDDKTEVTLQTEEIHQAFHWDGDLRTEQTSLRNSVQMEENRIEQKREEKTEVFPEQQTEIRQQTIENRERLQTVVEERQAAMEQSAVELTGEMGGRKGAPEPVPQELILRYSEAEESEGQLSELERNEKISSLPEKTGRMQESSFEALQHPEKTDGGEEQRSREERYIYDSQQSEIRQRKEQVTSEETEKVIKEVSETGATITEKIDRILEKAESVRMEGPGDENAVRSETVMLHVNPEETAVERLRKEAGETGAEPAAKRNIPTQESRIPEREKELPPESVKIFQKELVKQETFQDVRNRLEKQVEQYLNTEESVRTEVSSPSFYRDGDIRLEQIDQSVSSETEEIRVYQNPEENPELLREQLTKLNQKNIENWNRLQRVLETEKETVKKVVENPAARMRREGLKALSNPQELLLQFRKEEEAEQQAHEEVRRELFNNLPEETRRIFETVSRYQQNPQSLEPGEIGQNQMGMLLHDIRQTENETLQERTISEETAETIREVSENVLEKWQEGREPETVSLRRTEESRKDVTLVHKQVEQLDEEMLEELLARQRMLNQKNQVTEHVTEENHTVRTKTLNQQNQIIQRETENLTELIQRGVQKQIGSISDQIYSRLEKKLQNEKKRRGF